MKPNHGDHGEHGKEKGLMEERFNTSSDRVFPRDPRGSFAQPKTGVDLLFISFEKEGRVRPAEAEAVR